MAEPVKINAAGTMADGFRIGKRGPTILQGSSDPQSQSGLAGDLYIRHGDIPRVFLKESTGWTRIITDLLHIGSDAPSDSTYAFWWDDTEARLKIRYADGIWVDANPSGTITAEDIDPTPGTIALRDFFGSLSANAITANSASISGGFSHGGLTPSNGTGIDQVSIFPISIRLTPDWQDTGIDGTDLSSGTYLIQLSANDLASGGTQASETYAGTMVWYAGQTSSSAADEIPLHRAGASTGSLIYLRTARTSDGYLKLQIRSSVTTQSVSTYSVKLRRLL